VRGRRKRDHGGCEKGRKTRQCNGSKHSRF
jgi:hypothetical protein